MSYRKYSDLGNNTPSKPSYKVMQIQNGQHKHDVIRNNAIVCIDVYAHWCKPCKVIAPEYAVMAKKYAGICTLVEEDLELKLSQNITAVPTFLFFYKGQFHSSISGADLRDVEKRLQELLGDIDKPPDVLQTPPPTNVGYPSGGGEALYRSNFGQNPHPQAYPSFNH